jgi:acyl-coenzyme A thioesterase PaaI-like protein
MSERASPNLPNQIQMMLDGSIPPPPIAKLIGFKLVSIGSGKAVIEFEAGDRHVNPMGTLHGGVLCDISDAAMGMAYASRLKGGRALRHWNLKSTSLS